MTDKDYRIIKAAVDMFAKEGLSIPASSIADKADVSNGTLFNYFATKQDLYDEVFFALREEIANDLIANLDLEASTHDLFFEIWRSYIHWAQKHPKEHLVIGMLRASNVLSPEVHQATDEFFVAVYETMERAIDEKLLINMPIDYLVAVAIANLHASVNYVRDKKLKGDALEKFAITSFALYWKAITRT